ncbi:hypothetical protein K458DRAFT_396635 [Lentithecium fluviatile CBS 122367]|uniref:Ubiquitin-like domain-containing protein n=1 Tax=Lentithecium fluviatile CBS 122367 TaxID=1168545 RepID=A0A6G1IF36_9PLEO|nr:hypothetical protein K458DRAFT_396635 [Lentithecium fluviatile CBS 122367]
MPVAFGWSAGDIAKAIELLATVYKGLHETGGVASEYQHITEFLRGLILTLQHLQTLHIDCTDPSFAGAIKALTKAALDPIFEFIDDVSKYEPSLGRGSTRGNPKSGYRKAEYALRMPKRLAKLQADLEMKLEPIHLLMGYEGLKQNSLAASRLSGLQTTLQTQTEEQRKFNMTLMSAITDLTGAITKVTCNTREDHPHEHVSPTREGGERSVIRSLRRPPTMPYSASDEGRMLTQWKEAGTYYVACNLLFLLAKVAALTRYLLSVSQQLILYLRTLFIAIARSNRLLLHDAIHVEDFLGRVHHLPYQYFSIYEVFHPHLTELFKHQPGKELVESHSYQILYLNKGFFRQDWVPNPSNHSARAVLPISLKLEGNISQAVPYVPGMTAVQ